MEGPSLEVLLYNAVFYYLIVSNLCLLDVNCVACDLRRLYDGVHFTSQGIHTNVKVIYSFRVIK